MDEDIFPAPKHPPKLPQGVDPPTAYSYTVFRQRIAELEGRILATFQNLQHPVHVSDVLALDKSMRELQDNLPFYFRARLTKDGVECDKSLDSTYGFLNVHRFLLHTEINSVRIALHRPYLLRSGGPNGARFLPCRQASLNAALHDLEMRSDFVLSLRKIRSDDEPLLLYRVQIGTYKYFHSLLVVGVVLLMDPNAPDAPKLKAHLQHYVDNYRSKPASHRDEMRDREANVIGIFLSRIEQVEKASASSKATTTRAASTSRAPKRARSTDVGRRSETNDRESKSSKKSRESGAERGDEGADAHLLLGLGAQSSANGNEAGADDVKPLPIQRTSMLSESSTRSPRQDAVPRSSGTSSVPPSRQGSGDWSFNARGLTHAVGASSSGSNGNSPSTSSLPASLAAANPSGEPLTTGSTTPSMAPAPNGGGEDAQQFFDAWYQAEWAAATMPSYDAAYNGANGLGGGAAGVSLGLDSLGSLGGVFNNNSTGNAGGPASMSVGQGLGGGFNGLGGPSIGGFALNTGGAAAASSRSLGPLTPGAVISGWTSQAAPASSGYAADQTSSSSDPLANLISGTQSLGSSNNVWQQQQIGAMPAQNHAARLKSEVMAAPETLSSSAFGGTSSIFPGDASSQQNPAGFDGQAQTQNFDPAFWQTLIDKIIT